MPMSTNRLGVDTAFPPPPPPHLPPPPPGYAPQPPRPSARAHRRWPLLAGAAVVGAVIASAAAAVITIQVRDSGTVTSGSPAPVSVTVAAPTPSSPAPLPALQADRQTCQQGWLPAGRLIDSATGALNVLPKGMRINDPAIQSNPEWSAAVVRAGDFYHQASEALDRQIAAGTTPILLEAATTAVKALRSLGDATSAPGEINGNAFDIANEAAAQVGVLCTRLAP